MAHRLLRTDVVLTLFRRALVAIGLISCFALPAFAQTGNEFAVGLEAHYRGAVGDDLIAGNGWGLTWRIGHDKSGWGWQYGLNWFSSNLEAAPNGSISGKYPASGGRIDIGELHVRPLMGGYGYTIVKGRYAFTAAALAGYAF